MHAISILFVLLLQYVCLPLLVFQQAGVVMTDFVIILSPVTHRPASHDICHSMHTHTLAHKQSSDCVCALIHACLTVQKTHIIPVRLSPASFIHTLKKKK